MRPLDGDPKKREIRFWKWTFSDKKALPGMIIFVLIQVLITLIKLEGAILGDKELSKLLPSWTEGMASREILMGVAIIYFGNIILAILAQSYGVFRLFLWKDISNEGKWEIFKNAFFNSRWNRKYTGSRLANFFLWEYKFIIWYIGVAPRFFLIHRYKKKWSDRY